MYPSRQAVPWANQAEAPVGYDPSEHRVDVADVAYVAHVAHVAHVSYIADVADVADEQTLQTLQMMHVLWGTPRGQDPRIRIPLCKRASLHTRSGKSRKTMNMTTFPSGDPLGVS